MSTLRFIVAGSLVALCASSFAQTTPSRDDRMAQALQNYRSKPVATSPAMSPHMSPRHAMQHKAGVKHHHGKKHGPASSRAPVGKKSPSDMTKG